jgi:hypothetical protein
MKQLLLFGCFVSLALTVRAEIQFRTVEYKQGDTVLEGLSVYDDTVTGKRPGVLVAHQWKGLGNYERARAEMLARLGGFGRPLQERSRLA